MRIKKRLKCMWYRFREIRGSISVGLGRFRGNWGGRGTAMRGLGRNWSIIRYSWRSLLWRMWKLRNSWVMLVRLWGNRICRFLSCRNRIWRISSKLIIRIYRLRSLRRCYQLRIMGMTAIIIIITIIIIVLWADARKITTQLYCKIQTLI